MSLKYILKRHRKIQSLLYDWEKAIVFVRHTNVHHYEKQLKNNIIILIRLKKISMNLLSLKYINRFPDYVADFVTGLLPPQQEHTGIMVMFIAWGQMV